MYTNICSLDLPNLKFIGNTLDEKMPSPQVLQSSYVSYAYSLGLALFSCIKFPF